ncbi:MAG: molybdopterin molybdotransferase MoeA, partial [Deltaproteobacteria bacterium]|nr:molybdopterin molybdotransferase MoeA [Deltaproteobacteria bacterium]
EETIPLEESFGRVLSRDVISPEDLPGFRRSSMDGYAVRAKETFGASESLPALLEVIGEVPMGVVPTVTMREGAAVRISTGGMLPEGSDAVVMIEHCHLMDAATLEVARAVSPQENVIRPGDDFLKGATVLRRGWMLRPQDVGVMAGLGSAQVHVFRRPRVALISTGDEVIPMNQKPKPGEVRDINTYTLKAFCERCGAEPVVAGLCGDNFERLRAAVSGGLMDADTVWISGGSSVGVRDLTVKVLESFEGMDLLVHGISISPGKPTILAQLGPKGVFGLPGHTASAMVVAEVFLAPFLSILGGKTPRLVEERNSVTAVLSRNVESASGREDYIRVKLVRTVEGWTAEPIFGKSGLISTLVEADGLVRVGRNMEGLYQGDVVKVLLF